MADLILKANGMSFSAIDKGEGPVVLLLHGFPDTHHTWQLQIDALVAAGFRCIAPVMRGYEPSSQVSDGDYTLDTLATDVQGWLNHLGLDKVHLIGHDWGALVSYAAACKYPERFYSLTTLAIPHPVSYQQNLKQVPIQYLNSSYMLFFQWRGLADWVVRRRNFSFLVFLWRRWSPGWQWPASVFNDVRHAFSQPGVVQATLGYYRSLFSKAHKLTSASSSGVIRVPSLALTGVKDGCMDTRMFAEMESSSRFAAGIHVESVQDAGHFLHLEQPEQINKLILAWLNRHQPDQQIDEMVAS